MQKITTCLWFKENVEEAAKYYVDTFKNSKMGKTTFYSEAASVVPTAPAPGTVMTVDFEIEGAGFTILNGGEVPGFNLSPATSFQILCDDQEEIDYYWEKLSSVPEAEQCGWCTDKFGVTWQVVPRVLNEMLDDPDKAKVERVTAAFMQMKKFDIAELQKAFDQE